MPKKPLRLDEEAGRGPSRDLPHNGPTWRRSPTCVGVFANLLQNRSLTVAARFRPGCVFRQGW